MKYTKELGRKLLESLPEYVKAVACDRNGLVCSYTNIPRNSNNVWRGRSYYVIGKYDCDDWEDSLVVRDEEEKWVPEEGDKVYYPDFGYPGLMYSSGSFSNNFDYLKKLHLLGLLFRTKEEAIACAKKMLEVVK